MVEKNIISKAQSHIKRFPLDEIEKHLSRNTLSRGELISLFHMHILNCIDEFTYSDFLYTHLFIYQVFVTITIWKNALGSAESQLDVKEHLLYSIETDYASAYTSKNDTTNFFDNVEAIRKHIDKQYENYSQSPDMDSARLAFQNNILKANRIAESTRFFAYDNCLNLPQKIEDLDIFCSCMFFSTEWLKIISEFF